MITKAGLVELIEYWASELLDANHKKPTETHRWVFCYNGEQGYELSLFDCACCLSDEVRKQGGCECICHERIASLAEYLSNELKD